MPVAYVSEQCDYCTQFVRALDASPLASAVRVLSVERIARIPHYVVAVPTLVVEDDAGISVFEADDAFDAVESATRRERARDATAQNAQNTQHAQTAQHVQTAQHARREDPAPPAGPQDFDGQSHFAGIDAADEPDTFGCRANNFETLVSAEQDAMLTAQTMAVWESSLRAESQSAQERSADSADKRLESLMQQRQVAAASRVG
jgi:hypothetical protein